MGRWRTRWAAVVPKAAPSTGGGAHILANDIDEDVAELSLGLGLWL